MNPEPDDKKTIGRRSFLNIFLTAGASGWIATVLYPVIKYLKPEQRASASEAVLSDGDKKKIADNNYAIVKLGNERVIVFTDTNHKLRALEAKCTHEGCTVQYKPDEEIIWCACHNGKFNVNGQRVFGPPPRDLMPFKVSGELTGKVVVSKT